MKRILLLLTSLLLVMVPCSLGAQSKKETAGYQKLLKKPSIAAAEKFIKKFPESVYTPKAERLRDSLELITRTSLISKEQALQAAGECLDAIGWKKDNKEHVIALDTDLGVRVLSPQGVLEYTHSIPLYTLEETPGAFKLVLPIETVSPLGKRNYLHFAYMNGDTEYVEVLYLPEEDILHQAMFYGTPLKDGKIEGQSPESIEGLDITAEVAWLGARLAENPSLVPLSKADLLTDESIRWWLQKNPGAATSAKKIAFGGLDPESSLVEKFKKCSKEKGKTYSAAVFDIRGYTVICASAKGEYTLVWAEPVCRNKNRDKYISTIYFESDGTTLDVCYYKGKTTFKYKISMANQSIRR